MIGAILAFSILASEIVFSKNEDIWQIDPVTGVVCSVLLLLYGIWYVTPPEALFFIKNGYPYS